MKIRSSELWRLWVQIIPAPEKLLPTWQKLLYCNVITFTQSQTNNIHGMVTIAKSSNYLYFLKKVICDFLKPNENMLSDHIKQLTKYFKKVIEVITCWSSFERVVWDCFIADEWYYTFQLLSFDCTVERRWIML